MKAEFENADQALFPNQFVNARLLLDVARDATVIPSVAIQRGNEGPFVFVVKPDQSVAMRRVKVGVTAGDNAAIEEGLAVGELVVVDGADKLREGSKVQTRENQPERTRTRRS